MPSLGMLGPYPFGSGEVDKRVTKKSAGNYALGVIAENGTFTVNYVGRSDSDVKGELKQNSTGGTHAEFKFSYASSAKEAFEKECNNYHDFMPSENEIHPRKPDGATYLCPHRDQ